MSRKHYIEAAKIIARHTAQVAWVTEDERTTAKSIAVELADMFARDNSAFDRTRFFDACGFRS